MVASIHAVHSSRSKGALSPIDRILQQQGALGNPFKEFYLIIMDVMMGSQSSAQQQNIDKFAGQLNAMNGYLARWEDMKSDFYASSNIHESSQPFVSDTSKLMNDIFGKWMKQVNLPQFGDLHQNYLNMQAIKKYLVNVPPSSLNQFFPVLGGKNALSLLKNIMPLVPFFSSRTSGRRGPDDSFDSIWASASGTNNNAENFLPKPSLIQSYQDEFSEGSGMLGGVGGVESSTLQMKQQSFNRLQSFIKSMLTDWVQAKKNFNSSMSQANN